MTALHGGMVRGPPCPGRPARHVLEWCVILAAVAAVVFSAGTGSALAATATASFQVTISVPAICQIQATNLAFPQYTNAADPGTATITITCSSSTPYNVGLNAGTGIDQTVNFRSMSLGTGTQIGYGLFSDSAHSVNWGMTIGTDTVQGTGTGYAQTLTVYGLVLAGQAFAAKGIFTDTVIATITY
jgi:spore coat protein U-like protein